MLKQCFQKKLVSGPSHINAEPRRRYADRRERLRNYAQLFPHMFWDKTHRYVTMWVVICTLFRLSEVEPYEISETPRLNYPRKSETDRMGKLIKEQNDNIGKRIFRTHTMKCSSRTNPNLHDHFRTTGFSNVEGSSTPSYIRLYSWYGLLRSLSIIYAECINQYLVAST